MFPEINIFAIIVAGLIPSIMGAIYYGPLFGKQWLSSLGKTEEEMKPDNPAVAYGLSMLFSMLLAFSLFMVIQLMHKGVNENGELILNSHNSFGHGALHGAMIGFCIGLPVLISLSLFQKSSGKNILLNAIFWIVCFALMGAIVDGWR